MIFVVDKSWFFFLFWPTRSPPWICHCMIPTYLCHGGPDGWTTSLLCLGGGWCSVGTFEPQFLPHFSHEHIYVFLSRCCYPHLYYHDHHHYHNCFYDICCCLPSIHPVLYIFCVHLYGNLPGRTIFCLCYDPDLSNNYAQIFRCYSAYKCWICCWILSRSSEGIGGTLLVSVPIVGSGTLCRSYRTSLSGIFYLYLLTIWLFWAYPDVLTHHTKKFPGLLHHTNFGVQATIDHRLAPLLCFFQTFAAFCHPVFVPLHFW